MAYLDDIHVLGELDQAAGDPMPGAVAPLEGTKCLQEVAGRLYPLGEEAVALSQLPTRWGGLGLTSAQRLVAAEWLGSWAHVWKCVAVMFPVVWGLLPHLPPPPGGNGCWGAPPRRRALRRRWRTCGVPESG
ncbi:hypothetical protein CYMTET_16001 [Cymbomonas tetramitiformis]|uniref:Uncharacterized protein n=1 Tax=Cymbomonas tetramitiformis TaxID=36881 RepID=A0AAE0GD80_9CHLO|nr:hypothetical protein CYMTET_16001 [Cymbomonas tetramitiformis]